MFIQRVFLVAFGFCLLLFSSVNATVFTHVDNEKIGFVLDQVVSNDGNTLYAITVDDLLVYSVNPETGEILEKRQSFNEGNIITLEGLLFSPAKLVKSPDGNQVYLSANFGVLSDSQFPWDESVLQFDIKSDGNLTYQDRTTLGTSINGDMVITSDGKYIYVSSNNGDIGLLTRAPNGKTTYIDKINQDLYGIDFDNTGDLLISPDNKNLYASSTFNDGHLHVLSINQNSGELTSIQTLEHESLSIASYQHDEHPKSKAVGGRGIAISNDGLNLYTIPDRYSPEGTLATFKRNSDGTVSFQSAVIAPTEDGSSLSILFSPDDVVVSPSQKYVYALDAIKGNIGVWKRNSSNGNLEYVDVINDSNSEADFTTGAEYRMTLSDNGYFLYTNNQRGIIAFDLRTDLSIVKTDSVDPVSLNGTIDYTLSVTNESTTDAYNVVITDELPAGTSYVSGSVNSNSGNCAVSSQKVTCTIDLVRAGEGYNAALKVNAPNVEGQLTNTGEVSSNQLDKEIANNSDTETTNIGSEGVTTDTSTSSSSSGGGSIPLNFLGMIMSFLFVRRLFVTRNPQT